MQSTNQPTISVEDFAIYGRGSPLGHVIKLIQRNVCSPDPWWLHMKYDRLAKTKNGKIAFP